MVMSEDAAKKARRDRAAKVIAEGGRTAGGIAPDEALALAKELKSDHEFALAWRVLEKMLASVSKDSELWVPFHQIAALCTYKDTHLGALQRLERGLEILNTGDDIATTTDPETLGLAGAIHKRMWEVRSDVQQLELSLAYYSRGHAADRESGFSKKQGYPGINAAFVLDMLASLDERRAKLAGATSELAAERRARARDIREQIVDGLTLPPDPLSKDAYWVAVTLAEALFGLRRYEDAGNLLARVREISDVPAWEFETTARQLAALARLLGDKEAQSSEQFVKSTAGSALKALLGDEVPGIESIFLGKVGLALSGGGFRASLYQIGVLARLADLDMLRHVEVISCVSGGSILGAYYYLELRRLLRDKEDSAILRGDYIELVKRVESGFLEGVQKNVRTRVAADLPTNLKMIFDPSYSRTQRIGELYEEHIYSNVKDGTTGWERDLTELYITPKGQERFNLKNDNWRRRNKVPMLVLNATTLNTGHNWQFTASFMGEPSTAVDPNIDPNYRLRRLYYKDAPAGHKQVRLGTAVGASACVPGLFEPILLKKLYEHPEGKSEEDRRINVRLVDGGVHDNQGLVGLHEQECNVLLVADASGQMETDDDPSKGLLGVPLRSNGILQFRVRGSQFMDLAARLSAGLLRSTMLVHLKLDLTSEPVDWIGCTEPALTSWAALPPERRGPLTFYKIPRSVQEKLAGIRTDLDSFNEAEAWSLMYSGYRATEHVFPMSIDGFPAASPEGASGWGFFEIAPLIDGAGEGSAIQKVLAVGSHSAFKAWMLWTPLKLLGVLLLAVAGVAGAWAAWNWRDYSLLTVADIGLMVVMFVATLVVGKLVMKIVRFRETASKVLTGIAMSVGGFLLAGIHLVFFDPIFLWLGSAKRLKRLDKR